MTKDPSLHLTAVQLGLANNPAIKDADPLASDSGDAGKRPPMCEDCGKDRSDPPSKLCPGCQAYKEHTC